MYSKVVMCAPIHKQMLTYLCNYLPALDFVQDFTANTKYGHGQKNEPCDSTSAPQSIEMRQYLVV